MGYIYHPNGAHHRCRPLPGNRVLRTARLRTPARSAATDELRALLRRFEPFGEFAVPSRTRCGGVLKPDVVFYGESVPRSRVDAAIRGLERAEAVLVVGSSLMVYSGYRFVHAAAQSGKPVAAVNLGRTRADELLTLKVSEPCALALAAV